MTRSIEAQIRANRRASVLLAAVMIVLLGAVGSAFGAPFGWLGTAIGAGVGAFLGLLATLIGWLRGTKWTLDISSATPAGAGFEQLRNVTDEAAVAAGIRPPQIFVIHDAAPNAFATGNGPNEGVVVVTSGLLKTLDRDELHAVVAHEVAHIRNNDIRFMTTIIFVAGVVPLVRDILRALVWESGIGWDKDGWFIWLLGTVAILFLWAISPIFTCILKLAISRKREFLADATAVQLTRDPDALARALVKLTHSPRRMKRANGATEHLCIVNPFRRHEDWGGSLFSTHPTLGERLRALGQIHGTRRKILLGEEASEL